MSDIHIHLHQVADPTLVTALKQIAEAAENIAVAIERVAEQSSSNEAQLQRLLAARDSLKGSTNTLESSVGEHASPTDGAPPRNP